MARGTGSPVRVNSPATTPPPDDLLGFTGASEAADIHSFGTDQQITQPNEDIAAGPTDLVETVNSSIVVFNRSGAILGSSDLNDFMDVDPGFSSTEPRVIFDDTTDRFWVTITEVPKSGCAAGPVLIAVSGSANPLPFTSWLVYSLPISNGGTTFTDEPGLGGNSSTIVVTFNDFTCSATFLGSETDILQKTDYENNSGSNSLDVFTSEQFAPQPVEAYTGDLTDNDYVVTNESDCGTVACAHPEAEVDSYTGTPETGGMFVQQWFVPMTPTAVDNTTQLLPPADQPAPGPLLVTDDDRFWNAVESPNGTVWATGGTSCEPSGDTVQRACLDYLEFTVDNVSGPQSPTLKLQLNDVGVDGASLFYPAVSIDNDGNMISVFDESSTSMDPSIMDTDVAPSGTTLSSFQTLHTSSTYFDATNLPPGSCGSGGCFWGDYSGAALDQAANPNDVWVVSESEDDTIEGPCSAHACWNTYINQLTLSGADLVSTSPATGPVAGGQTVTAHGFDFASDTTFTFNGSPLAISNLTPDSFTFVTPPGSAAGGAVALVASDSLGSTQIDVFYRYIGLSNYVPVPPSRLLDTRTNGGPLGPGAIRVLPITGVPSSATSVVLNVTEVNGTAASLLTVYPVSTNELRPQVSNLNFAAHTVIANLVTVSLIPDDEINIYNALGTVNVLVDIEGYFEQEPSTDFEGLFHPIAPFRVCDTRHPSPTPVCSAHGAMGPETAMVVNVTGASQIPSSGTAGAAVVNLTGVAGSASTYLSLFPTDSSGGCQYTGSHAPTFSTINLPAGAVQANRVMVGLGPSTSGGPDTSLCVYNAAGNINVLIDANGWYGSSTAPASPAGYQFQGIEPTRICDTRVSSTFCLEGSIGPASSKLIPVAGDGEIPATAGTTTVVAIVANLTAVAPTATTFLTLYPANLRSRPQASDLNLNSGVVLPNLVVVQLDATGDANDGDVYLYNSAGSVNAIIDIEGWFQ
jgi:hypothetical protein